MKSASARVVPLLLLVFVTSASGCGDSTESSSAELTSPPFPATAPAITGTITASPNPIPVCDGSGLGVTHLSWTAPPGVAVEVRVGKPDGTLFARTGNVGEGDTGKWIGQGAVFYLVRVAPPGAPATVLGSTKVGITKEGCR